MKEPLNKPDGPKKHIKYTVGTSSYRAEIVGYFNYPEKEFGSAAI